MKNLPFYKKHFIGVNKTSIRFIETSICFTNIFQLFLCKPNLLLILGNFTFFLRKPSMKSMEILDFF
jgi:hypothetical protein